MFVSGVGGTGKLFLIEMIKALVCEEWASKDVTCAITAPTGLAACRWLPFTDSFNYLLSTTAKLLATGLCQSRLRK